MGAREEFGSPVPALVVCAQAGAAREEALVKVVVVDGDRLHQGGAHHRWEKQRERREVA